MKKVFAIFALCLLASACAKKSNINGRRLSAPVASPTPTADAQAQSVGLDISWQTTDVENNENGETVLTHRYLVNGQEQTHQMVLRLNTGSCADANQIPYDAQMSPATQGLYAAVGTSSCVKNGRTLVALNMLLWNTQTLTQQVVLFSFDENLLLQTNKMTTDLSSGIYLPSWLSSQSQVF